jgi:hypothetical protein
MMDAILDATAAPITALAVVHLMTRSTVVTGTTERKSLGQGGFVSVRNW